jgi:hypothetical protein
MHVLSWVQHPRHGGAGRAPAGRERRRAVRAGRVPSAAPHLQPVVALLRGPQAARGRGAVSHVERHHALHRLQPHIPANQRDQSGIQAVVDWGQNALSSAAAAEELPGVQD